MSALAVAALLAAPDASAQVFCGDVLTANTTMTADIVGCAIDPAVTLDGADLDMDGFEIVGCVGDGVHLIGGSARLENGSVSGCANQGIVVSGTGGHRVQFLRSHSHGDAALLVQSSGNRFDYVHAAQSDMGFRFEVAADDNDLRYCSAVSNGTGVAMYSDSNKLTDSVVGLSSSVGLDLTGDRSQVVDASFFESSIVVAGDRNKLKRIYSIGNQTAVGAHLIGNQNRFERAQVHGYTTGVQLDGDDSKIKRVASTGNVDQGFHVFGLDNSIRGDNLAFGNGGDGIFLELGADDNDVRDNVASDHGGFDLRDDNPACASNNWQSNIEDTTNDVCVD